MKTTQTQADLYFENGTIYTVDAHDTIVEALAVKDGIIIFVGSAAEGEVYKGLETEVVDLAGGMLLPGFTDTHIHSATMNLTDFNLLECQDIDSTIQAIQEHVEQNSDQEAYHIFGYTTCMFTGEEAVKGPRKERLDAICPDKPMFIYSFDGHSAWLNSKFFEYSGITKDTKAPKGGTIEKDDVTGELWGTLRDSAMAMRPKKKYNSAKIRLALMGLQRMLNSLGYTSIQTHPAFGWLPVPWEGYHSLEQEGLLSLRVHGSVGIMSWRIEKDLAILREIKNKYASDMLRAKTAKFFMDGVVDSHTAYLLEPYADMPDFCGVPSWDIKSLGYAFSAVNEMGIQIHAHSIGDGATKMALDALEYAQEHAPVGDYRNSITHLQLVAKSDIMRFSELGVIAVAQPFWHFKQPDYWEQIDYTALGKRAEQEYPMRSFLDANVMLAFSSDFPVTSHIDPFIAIETGVTRNLAKGESYGVSDITDMDDPTYLLWPEERITVQEMIRGYTAAGAYTTFSEEKTGTLETGKAADLIVLDQDLFAIDPLQISKTIVLQTYLNGKLVYSRDSENKGDKSE